MTDLSKIRADFAALAADEICARLWGRPIHGMAVELSAVITKHAAALLARIDELEKENAELRELVKPLEDAWKDEPDIYTEKDGDPC